MTFWTALMFIALGVLLRMAFERPSSNRFKDVDQLARRHRDEGRAWGMWSL